MMLPAFHQSYYAQRISRLISATDEKPVVIEIGGGYW